MTHILKILLNGVLLLVFGIASIDMYGNPFTVSQYTSLDSSVFLILALCTALFIRLYYKKTVLLPFASRLVLFLFISSLSTSIILTMLEHITPPNYIYSLFRLNFQRMFAVAVVSGLFLLFQQPNKWFEHYRTSIIVSFSLIIPLMFYFVSLFPYSFLLEIAREDNIVEYVQFVALLVAVFFSAKVALKLIRGKKRALAIIFSCISVGLLFVSGDEISWGQRLFGIQTPPTIAQYNAQNELSWHNLVQVGNLPTYAYILIGLYGSFSWLLQPLLKYSSVLLFIVPRQLFLYFFIPLLFQIRFIIGNHYLGVWAEPTELILYIGTALYTFLVYSFLITKKNKLFYNGTPI